MYNKNLLLHAERFIALLGGLILYWHIVQFSDMAYTVISYVFIITFFGLCVEMYFDLVNSDMFRTDFKTYTSGTIITASIIITYCTACLMLVLADLWLPILNKILKKATDGLRQYNEHRAMMREFRNL